MFNFIGRRGRSSLGPDSIVVDAGLGWASFEAIAPQISGLRYAALYRVPTGEFLTRPMHIVGERFTVTPGFSLSVVDGDIATVDLITNGEFSVDASWTKTGGWGIAAGVATKSPGSGGNLTQAISGGLPDGGVYRWKGNVSGRTAGAASVRHTGGGGDVLSSTSLTANGAKLGTITAANANTSVRFVADASYDGSVDDFAMFLETPTCAPQGIWDYIVELYDRGGALVSATDRQTMAVA